MSLFCGNFCITLCLDSAGVPSQNPSPLSGAPTRQSVPGRAAQAAGPSSWYVPFPAGAAGFSLSTPLTCYYCYCPGKCFRLYPEDERLPVENRPLILESNITPTVLFLKRLEIAGLAQCDFMDRPGE